MNLAPYYERETMQDVGNWTETRCDPCKIFQRLITANVLFPMKLPEIAKTIQYVFVTCRELL